MSDVGQLLSDQIRVDRIGSLSDIRPPTSTYLARSSLKSASGVEKRPHAGYVTKLRRPDSPIGKQSNPLLDAARLIRAPIMADDTTTTTVDAVARRKEQKAVLRPLANRRPELSSPSTGRPRQASRQPQSGSHANWATATWIRVVCIAR